MPASALEERRPLGDRIFQVLALAAGLLVLVILVLIAVSTSQQASSWFSTEGLKIFSKTWDPTNNQFGALPFIYGTVITGVIALVMAVPVSVGIALLLTEVVPRAVGAADRLRDRPPGGGPVGGLGPLGHPGVRALDRPHLHLDSRGRQRRPGARPPVRASPPAVPRSSPPASSWPS